MQSRLTRLEQQHENDDTTSQTADKKRWRDDSPSTLESPQSPAKKKLRKESVSDNTRPLPFTTSTITHLPSPASMMSTPDPLESTRHYSPPHFDTQTNLDSGFNPLNTLSSGGKSENSLPSFSSFNCGFCDQNTICVCREMAVHDAMDQSMSSDVFENDVFDNDPIVSNGETSRPSDLQATAEDPGKASQPLSILDNLPAYQPPVPLKRRAKGVSVNSIFPVRLPPRRDTRMLEATCSGDPDNCLACADDSFGKAFCAAISNNASGACECAAKVTASSSGGCCGGTGNCTSCPSMSSESSNDVIPPATSDDPPELMATNDAWQKLKEHPNVDFSDLSLLAEVVASRSKCFGPRLVISPAPQMLEQGTSTTTAIDRFNDGRGLDGMRRAGHSPPPRLVPQEILLECGRRRMQQVNAAGVREALRLLDAKFSS